MSQTKSTRAERELAWAEETRDFERQMRALALREQTAKAERAESKARIQTMIEEAVRREQQLTELPKLKA